MIITISRKKKNCDDINLLWTANLKIENYIWEFSWELRISNIANYDFEKKCWCIKLYKWLIKRDFWNKM